MTSSFLHVHRTKSHVSIHVSAFVMLLFELAFTHVTSFLNDSRFLAMQSVMAMMSLSMAFCSLQRVTVPVLAVPVFVVCRAN